MMHMQDLLMTKLEDYASEPGKSAMDLVLFRYTASAVHQMYSTQILFACVIALFLDQLGSHIVFACTSLS